MTISVSAIVFWSKCFGIAIALTGLTWYFDIFSHLESADLKSAAGVVAQIAATMLGFVLAALAILATVANTRLMRNMQRTGHYRVLLFRMFGSVAAFGVVTLAGLVFIFLPTLNTFYVYPFIGLIFLSVILLIDVSLKLWKVLHHLHPEVTA